MPVNTKPRPATFDDLDEYATKPVELVRITLDQRSIGHGLLRTVDDLVVSYRAVYADELVVTVDGDAITVGRVHTEEEKARKLSRAQADWDERNAERLAAEARDQLRVGDPFDPGDVVTPCRIYTQQPCALSFPHQGRHIDVRDGIVTKITDR